MDLRITDVRCHPGDSAFLIDDGKSALVYDTGFAFTGYEVARNIKAQLGSRPLDYILLTHSHYDHALGSAYIAKLFPGVKIVAGEYAAAVFENSSAKRVMRDLDRKFAAKCAVTEYEDLIDELHVDIPVKDGDVITVGDMHITAINLPGHTRCSVGYYLPEAKLLLSTETIGVFDGEKTVVPSYLVGYEMTLASIDRVQDLDIERILVPHLGILDKEKTALYLRTAKKSAITTAEEIVALLRSGKTRSDAVQFFKDKFYHGYIKTIYPPDAIDLNTGITVMLLEKELM